MPQLVTLLKWEVIIFLGALAGVVAIQLLNGQISLSGLFQADKNGKGDQFSSSRVQLLVLTLGAAFYYFTQVLENPTPGQFPPIPETWPVLLGGSNLLYLGNKAYTTWLGQKNTK
jgi:hypothetical protein